MKDEEDIRRLILYTIVFATYLHSYMYIKNEKYS